MQIGGCSLLGDTTWVVILGRTNPSQIRRGQVRALLDKRVWGAVTSELFVVCPDLGGGEHNEKAEDDTQGWQQPRRDGLLRRREPVSRSVPGFKRDAGLIFAGPQGRDRTCPALSLTGVYRPGPTSWGSSPLGRPLTAGAAPRRCARGLLDWPPWKRHQPLRGFEANRGMRLFT
jgi:hypothetical protein